MKTIQLTQSQIALVSDEDYDYLNQFKWYAQYNPTIQGFYVARRLNNHKIIYMHQEIAKRIGIVGMADHKDRNGLNNQRDNFRAATQSQNQANRRLYSNNTSGYRGVYWRKHQQKWQAKIQNQHLGLFDTPEEAAKAYNIAAIIYQKEFAQLNVITKIKPVEAEVDPDSFAMQPFKE